MDEEALEAQLEAELSGGASPAAVTPAPETPVAEAPTTEQPTAEPVETPVAEQPAEQPTSEQPTAEPEAPVVDDPESASGRFRLQGKLAAVAKLVKEGGMSEEEAIDRIYGQLQPPTPAEPAASEVPPVDPIATLETELADVRTKLKTAAAEGSLYSEELDALNERRSELLADIRIAKAQAEEQARYEAELQQQEVKSAADAIWNEDVAEIQRLYGDAALDDGPLGKAISEELDKIETSPNHRFHGAFQKGTLLPMDIAPYLAARLGIAPVTQQQATPVTQPTASTQPSAPAAKAQPATLPVSGGHRTTPTVPINPAQKQAALQSSLAQASVDPDSAADLLDAELSGGKPPVSRIRLA